MQFGEVGSSQKGMDPRPRWADARKAARCRTASLVRLETVRRAYQMARIAAIQNAR